MKASQIGIWVLLSFLCIIILSWIASSLISSKLEEAIPRYEFGTFKTKVGDVKVKLLVGNLTLHDVQLYDTVGFGSVSTTKIRFQGIQLLKLIFNKKIALRKVLINGANISLYLDENNKLILPQENNKTSKYNLIGIDKVQIIKANFLISQADPSKIDPGKIDSSKTDPSKTDHSKADHSKADSIFNTEFNLDLWAISNTNLKRFSYNKTNFDSLSFFLRNGSYRLANGLHNISYDTISYRGSENRLTIDLLLLKSRFAKYEIGKHTGVETDWFDFTVKGINMENIQLQNLISQNALIMSQIEINHFTGIAFKDKRLPFPEKPDTKLPIELLHSLPITLHIDSIILKDANIEYAERVKDSKKAGAVTFNNLSANIKNLSNIDSLITAPTTMHASANVMNEALLTANFIFPNVKYPRSYSAKGVMGSMDIASFNPILEQNASVLVESGKVNKLSFDFVYNNDDSKGNLYFDYNDLKISIIDKSDNKIKKTQTFLINNILLHKENLKTEKSFREGNVSFSRNKKRSIFNYWWKSLFSGIKNSVIL